MASEERASGSILRIFFLDCPGDMSHVPTVATENLTQQKPFLWSNHSLKSQPTFPLTLQDIQDAEARLIRFACVLQHLFPELASRNGRASLAALTR